MMIWHFRQLGKAKKPNRLEYGRLGVAADGTLYTGNADNEPVRQAGGSFLILHYIYPDAWSSDDVPRQTFSFPQVTATSVIEISLPEDATKTHVKEFQALNLQDGGQEDGSFFLRAFGSLNTAVVPINIIIRRDL